MADQDQRNAHCVQAAERMDSTSVNQSAPMREVLVTPAPARKRRDQPQLAPDVMTLEAAAVMVATFTVAAEANEKAARLAELVATTVLHWNTATEPALGKAARRWWPGAAATRKMSW